MAGIYIHIPFCRQACTYCNFHFTTSLGRKAEITDAINQEIILCDPYDDEEIKTIYFGGGTPSLLQTSELNSLLDSIKRKFPVAVNVEITLEANPDNIDPVSLAYWKAAGINRLSVGIQSFQEAELKWMNRAHTASESINCIRQIYEAGFNNFSVDLIYGSPLLNNDDLKKNADIIFEMKVPHISCYALTVEPKTMLDKMIRKNSSFAINNEKQSEQFLLLMQWMRFAGYEHYEISNFSKPGMRSRHNSSYWQGKSYYGFGPSAHSFNGHDLRRWNVANNTLYSNSIQKGLIPFTEEILTPIQQLNELIMISLRTSEGLDLDRVSAIFGIHYKNQILHESQKYITTGKIECSGSFIKLTDEGRLFADGIAADLFFTDVTSVKEPG